MFIHEHNESWTILYTFTTGSVGCLESLLALMSWNQHGGVRYDICDFRSNYLGLEQEH